MSHTFITAEMTDTCQRETLQQVEGDLVFYCIEYGIFLHDFKTKRTTEPSTWPASITTTATAPTSKEEAKESMGYALDTSERGCYRTLLDELITTDIPGYKNFIRMPPAFFDLIKERIYIQVKKSHKLQEATGSWLESGSYTRALVHRRKRHFIAVPMEGWQNYHL